MVEVTTEIKLLRLFRDLRDRPDFPLDQIKKKVAILSTPRCGSSMFCDVLKNTDLCGHPKEWLNIRHINAYRDLFDVKRLNLSTYINFILKKTTSTNGVFSINIHIEQYVQLLVDLKFDALKLNFDLMYFLSRRDKLAQSLSRTKASMTDQWSGDVASLDETTDAIPRSQVFESLLHISRSEELYESHLKKYVKHKYYYEDFRHLDETTIFSQILTECGIQEIPDAWKTSQRIQAGRESSRQVKALREYLGY